jgi:ATP-dependent RNA helicase DHX29
MFLAGSRRTACQLKCKERRVSVCKSAHAPRNSLMDRVDEAVINYDFIEHLLEHICQDKKSRLLSEDTGSCESGDAILVFLPGVGEINSLVDRLKATRLFGDGRKFKILPLHSGVSSGQQKDAFIVPGNGCRKIVVSTNIAETR